MANGISKNPLTDIGKVYLTQIAEGRLKSLEKASVLAMSDKPEDQDKAREIKTRYDYQSLMKQKKARKMKEDSDFTEARSDWRHDLREIIVTKDKDPEEPEIKEKKIKNKININPEFKEAVEQLGGRLLTVEEVEVDEAMSSYDRNRKAAAKRAAERNRLRRAGKMGGRMENETYRTEGGVRMHHKGYKAEEVEEDPKKAEQMRKKEKMLKKRMLMMKLRAVNQGAGGDVTAEYEPEGDMVEAKVDQGKDDAAKINTRNQRAFGNRRGQKGGMHRGDDMEARRYNTEKGRGVKMKGKKDKTPVDYHGQDRKKRIDALFKEKGIKEATRYAKETGKSFKSGKPVTKGGTAKDDKAFQAVAKKYAGQMMGGQQKKKVRGQKPDESNTPFKRAAERMKKIKMDNKALADKAKKAGYKSTQDYVNVQAVRKGGLGT